MESGQATRYDLVIVGAGAAGMAAAIDAGEAGLRTLVIEAFPAWGGAAATSGGGCCIVDTPLQRARGLRDSVDLALSDWLACGGATVDVRWARFYLENCRAGLFEWAQAHGAAWDALKEQEFNTVPRWHHARGGGEGLMADLHAAAEGLPLQWRFGERVEALVLDGGSVAGVRTPAGDVRAAAVLVATGGFNNNPDLVARHGLNPGPGSRILCGGARQATGSGHLLLAETDADLVHLDHIWYYAYATPDHRDASGRRGMAARGVVDDVWLNAQGRRFHDESRRGGASGTQALLAQRPATCWSVFDRRAADGLNLADPYYRSLDAPLRERHEEFLATSPYVHRADSFEELARAAGWPVDMARNTLDRYNGWLRDGVGRDPDWGKPLGGLRPIEKPPFYAVQFFPMARKNLGGVRTDLGCHALRPDGSPIPGLLAAGEVAGMAGGHINGAATLEGTMLGPSLFSGRVAARTVAQSRSAPT